jgi:hypothetical protein
MVHKIGRYVHLNFRNYFTLIVLTYIGMLPYDHRFIQ